MYGKVAEESENMKKSVDNRKLKPFFVWAAIIMLAGLCMILQGCKIEEQKDEKVQDLDFTVLQEKEVPSDILAMIDSKKQEAFQFTKTGGSYTYLVVGYGKQSTSGYSIRVEEVYLGKNAIYIETSLLGPKKDEAVSEIETYPYVVVKIEARDEAVVFK